MQADFSPVPMTKVYSRPAEAITRLNELGLTVDLLQQALRSGFAFMADCTSHDPSSTGGFIMWAKTNRSLRDQLIPRGWTRDDPENYPLTVHPEGGWAIAVVQGDPRTGISSETPSTKSVRGSATRSVVSQNQFRMLLIDNRLVPPVSGRLRQTWLLLWHFDDANELLRGELSLPYHMTQEGFVTEWAERIIFPDRPLNMMGQRDPVTPLPPDMGYNDDEIDVPVRKRA